MNFVTSGTPENIALAQQVNSRLRADATYVAARAFLFRAIGAGLFLCFVGAGIGAASYGWATLNQYDSAAEKLAKAMQTALSDVTLKTKGEVTLTDKTLRLEGLPKGATGGGTGAPAPTKAQLGEDAAPVSLADVYTTFTVFKQVPYLDGLVVTGWNFKDGAELPFQQYCYFSRRSNEPKGQVEIKIDLAMDGKTLPQPQKSDVNLEILARNCVWHAKK